MKSESEAKLLRIFVGESSKTGGTPVYEKIVTEARAHGLAGATVFKGVMGFGKSSIIHTSKIMRLSEDMPMIIEIVDKTEKIDDFTPIVREIFESSNSGGLITVEKAGIIHYATGKE
ncbi:MAG: DUF190 domain-containing protein [Ignavibacteriaceae bacterium]|nr:DUF190 domain-containing protein [Ignavibacteriaceae bacterium]